MGDLRESGSEPLEDRFAELTEAYERQSEVVARYSDHLGQIRSWAGPFNREGALSMVRIAEAAFWTKASSRRPGDPF